LERASDRQEDCDGFEFLLVRADLSDLDIEAAAELLRKCDEPYIVPSSPVEQPHLTYEEVAEMAIRAALGVEVNP